MYFKSSIFCTFLLDLRFAISKDRNKYVMTNVRCKGNESSIEDCDYRKLDSESINNIAALECNGKITKYDF